MNFLQKYNLSVVTRYGKGYISVEDAGFVIHALEQELLTADSRVKELKEEIAGFEEQTYLLKEQNNSNAKTIDSLLYSTRTDRQNNILASIVLLLVCVMAGSVAIDLYGLLQH